MKFGAFASFVITALFVSQAFPQATKGRDVVYNLQDWPDRPFFVHIPSGYKQGKPIPVVLSLHGGGGNAQAQMRISCPRGDLANPECLIGLSDRYGFIAVHPNGTEFPNYPGRRAWGDGENDSNCDPCHKANDIQFFRDLLDDLSRKFDVDPKRIYVMGLSNGGAMSYRLACELSDRIAAIASVGGGNHVIKSCHPKRPVPVLHFHGTADVWWPYRGGISPYHPGYMENIPDTTVGGIAKINGCKPNTVDDYIPKRVYNGTYGIRHQYQSCRAGGDVTFIEIVNGGHTWPGGFQYAPVNLVGLTNYDFFATEAMLAFFKKHSMP